MKLIEYHYVYYSYEEYDRGYIGSRTCKCLPEEDINYFGSFKDKTFKPTQKIILKSDYATREEAYTDEIILQRYYEVVENPHFANRAYQTSTGFSRKNAIPFNKGKKMSEEQRKKLSNSCIGRIMDEETKRKISLANTGRTLSEEHKTKISNSTAGVKKTKTDKLKLSIKLNTIRLTNLNRLPHTEETKRKLSEIAQGRVPWNKGVKGKQEGSNKKQLIFENIQYSSITDAVSITNKSRYYIVKYSTFL
jgi:hypothetical protein